MSFFLLHAFKFLSWIRIRKVSFWIRKPKSLILDKETEKSYLGCLPNVCPMSANVCSITRYAQHLPNVCQMSPISAQCPICLLNVLNICPMSHISAQCSQFLPNVLRGQISDFFQYVLTYKFLIQLLFGGFKMNMTVWPVKGSGTLLKQHWLWQ